MDREDINPKVIKKLTDYISHRTLKNYEIGFTWALFFNFGILFWFISNFDKFKIKILVPGSDIFKDYLINKWLFIICLVIISSAIICFSICRIIAYLGGTARDAGLDRIERALSKFAGGSNQKNQEQEIEAEKELKLAVGFLVNGHNLPISKLCLRIFRVGLILSAIGILMFIVYFVTFIYFYL